MNKIDQDGLLLCDIQAELFEESANKVECSSEVFIRRFMNSLVATEFDSAAFLDGTKTKENIFDEITEEYGKTSYGKKKFNKEALYWIGYIYRYFSYTYNLTSKQVYKIVKPKELNQVYLPYHTFDPKFAIERILEQKGVSFKYEDVLKKNYEIFKKVRLTKDSLLG